MNHEEQRFINLSPDIDIMAANDKDGSKASYTKTETVKDIKDTILAAIQSYQPSQYDSDSKMVYIEDYKTIDDVVNDLLSYRPLKDTFSTNVTGIRYVVSAAGGGQQTCYILKSTFVDTNRIAYFHSSAVTQQSVYGASDFNINNP